MVSAQPILSTLSTEERPRVAVGQIIYERDTERFFLFDQREAALGGYSWVQLHVPFEDTYLAGARAQFVANLAPILGDARLIWLPAASETTTSTDQSMNGRTITYDASIAARLSPLGFGQKVAFNGSANYGSTPDVDNLSFGNGSADQAFSIVALVNVTNTAASRAIVCKYAGAAREWLFQINGSDLLSLALFDESGDWQPTRVSNSAITQGSMRLFGMSYDGSGGATAMNGVTLFQDGLAIASTANNNADYVAMENTAANVTIGALSTQVANFFNGEMALVAVCQKNLSAAEHWAIRKACEGYFGFLG